jgi:peptide chain release factor 2
MNEVVDQLNQLSEKLSQIKQTIDPQETQTKVKELEAQSTDPDFWKDDQMAKKVMTKLAHLKEQLDLMERLDREIKESLEMTQMEGAFEDEGLLSDLQNSADRLKGEVDKLEIKTFLSGRHDSGDAIVSIHAGQGGTEAMDWAEMLLRMYQRFIESHEEWKGRLVAETKGEEAGIKSATIIVSGPFAYGYLKSEAGTHRLVRQSPFNADSLRQTSFALVEVLPEIEENDEIEVKDEDVEWQFFRSGGKGGQNVNKVSTAVRLKHLSSGIVVESQSERYQEQNRKIAMSILKGKLWQKMEKDRQKEIEGLRGQKMASWGTQIRSYVLHPYKMVKDLRTKVETSNTDAVLGGKIDEFVEAGLKLPLAD